MRAQRAMLSVGRDSRPVMRAAYSVFRGEAPVEELRAIGTSSTGHDRFYALLYEGLFFEARGDCIDDARKAILAACASDYGRSSEDYMAALARVHALRRGWSESAAVGSTGMV